MGASHRTVSHFTCISAGRRTVVVLTVLVLSSFLLNPTVAEISDTTHVLRFEAVPPYINLNFTTSIVVEIGASYGAGLDNYQAVVTMPNGTKTSVWYNFTTLGTISRVYGNRGLDFGAAVDQVGTYNLRLDFYNGTGFVPAAYATLSVTDILLVITEGAAASNEYTDVHNCPIAQEFQRGGEIIARAYVRYASTLGLLNGTTTPSAVGKVTGTLLGETKTLVWQKTYGFWRWAWYIPWNASVGTLNFTAVANDGMGNHGVGYSPASGLTAWKIVPAILKVTSRIMNQTSVDTVIFHPGDTMKIEAKVTYESHNQHNKAFPGALNTTRGGHVVATLGSGSYNVTSGKFANNLAIMVLTYNPASAKWTGTYQVKQNDPLTQDLRVVITATDGVSPPNTGTAFTTSFAFASPAEAPTSPPPVGGFDPLLVGGLAVLTLVAGLGAGWTVARRGRK